MQFWLQMPSHRLRPVTGGLLSAQGVSHPVGGALGEFRRQSGGWVVNLELAGRRRHSDGPVRIRGTEGLVLRQPRDRGDTVGLTSRVESLEE